MDDRYCIHRDSLIRQIQEKSGLPCTGDKLPADFSTVLKDIEILGRWGREPIPGKYDVIVKPTPITRRKSSQHRTFIVCEKCGREIPTGRLHQHRDACKL